MLAYFFIGGTRQRRAGNLLVGGADGGGACHIHRLKCRTIKSDPVGFHSHTYLSAFFVGISDKRRPK